MVLDTHGDYMTAETIENMAHGFLKSGNQRNIDFMHDGVHVSACIVESYIAQEGDPEFAAGAWVVGIHIEDETLWGKVLSGEINGLSLEALANYEEKKVEVSIPDLVVGTTSVDAGHSHTFKAKYNDKGEFVGGITDEVDGHSHVISHPTFTNTSDNHSHKFDSVEGFYILPDK